MGPMIADLRTEPAKRLGAPADRALTAVTSVMALSGLGEQNARCPAEAALRVPLVVSKSLPPESNPTPRASDPGVRSPGLRQAARR